MLSAELDVVIESLMLLFVNCVDCVREVEEVAIVISTSEKGTYVESMAVDD